MSFSAARDDVVGIIGNNGVGKSTLLEIICGLQKERAGFVIVNGAPLKAKARNKETFLVMQNSDCQLFSTLSENS